MKLITHKVLIVAAILATGSACAAATPANPTGQLEFSGTITKSACQVTINGSGSGNNLSFDETLTSSPTFTKGDVINNDTKNFNITLSQCSGATIDLSKIATTFTFTPADPTDPSYIADMSKNNSGLGFQILGANWAPAENNKAIAPLQTTNVQGGQTPTGVTLVYAAQMIATSTAVTANKAASASVPFTITFA